MCGIFVRNYFSIVFINATTMVMNFKVYDADVHMNNHHKRVKSAKSVVNTSAPFTYKLRHKHLTNKHIKSHSLSVSSLSKQCPASTTVKSNYEVSTRVGNATPYSERKQSLRSSSLPPRAFNVQESKDSPKYNLKNKLKEGKLPEDTPSKLPIPTPRISKKFPLLEIPEYEYIQFSLRITEDIIRNNLYSAQQMKRVFNSHVEANRGRLSMEKMLKQINKLSEELRIAERTEQDDECKCSAGTCKNKKQTITTNGLYSPDKITTSKAKELSKNLLIEKLSSGLHIINEEEIQQLSENDLQEIVANLLSNNAEVANSENPSRSEETNKELDRNGHYSNIQDQFVRNDKEKQLSIVLTNSEEQNYKYVISDDSRISKKNSNPTATADSAVETNILSKFSTEKHSIHEKESSLTNEKELLTLSYKSLEENRSKDNSEEKLMNNSNNKDTNDNLVADSDEQREGNLSVNGFTEKTKSTKENEAENRSAREKETPITNSSNLINFSIDNTSHDALTNNKGNCEEISNTGEADVSVVTASIRRNLSNILKEIPSASSVQPSATHSTPKHDYFASSRESVDVLNVIYDSGSAQVQESFIIGKEHSLTSIQQTEKENISLSDICKKYSFLLKNEEPLSKVSPEEYSLKSSKYKPGEPKSTQTTFSVENFLFLKPLQTIDSIDWTKPSSTDLSEKNLCWESREPDFVSVIQNMSSKNSNILQEYFSHTGSARDKELIRNVSKKSATCQCDRSETSIKTTKDAGKRRKRSKHHNSPSTLNNNNNNYQYKRISNADLFTNKHNDLHFQISQEDIDKLLKHVGHESNSKNNLLRNNHFSDVEISPKSSKYESNNLIKRNTAQPNSISSAKEKPNRTNKIKANNDDSISKQLEVFLKPDVCTQTSFTSVSSFNLIDLDATNLKAHAVNSRASGTQPDCSHQLSEGEMEYYIAN